MGFELTTLTLALVVSLSSTLLLTSTLKLVTSLSNAPILVLLAASLFCVSVTEETSARVFCTDEGVGVTLLLYSLPPLPDLLPLLLLLILLLPVLLLLPVFVSFLPIPACPPLFPAFEFGFLSETTFTFLTTFFSIISLYSAIKNRFPCLSIPDMATEASPFLLTQYFPLPNWKRFFPFSGE